MKKLLVCAFLLYSFPANSASVSEIWKKIRAWKPGEHISCEFVRDAYSVLGKARAESVARGKGATQEQINQKRAECGV